MSHVIECPTVVHQVNQLQYHLIFAKGNRRILRDYCSEISGPGDWNNLKCLSHWGKKKNNIVDCNKFDALSWQKAKFWRQYTSFHLLHPRLSRLKPYLKMERDSLIRIVGQECKIARSYYLTNFSSRTIKSNRYNYKRELQGRDTFP